MIRSLASVSGEDVTAAIRTPEVSQAASKVSALPAVRAALLDLQRRLGGRGGVVVEGRDTGTVVFPSAEAKFFLTASEEEIIAAMRLAWERAKLLIEPSAAVAVAVALSDGFKELGARRVAVVLSGGNVNLDRLPW